MKVLDSQRNCELALLENVQYSGFMPGRLGARRGPGVRSGARGGGVQGWAWAGGAGRDWGYGGGPGKGCAPVGRHGGGGGRGQGAPGGAWGTEALALAVGPL